MPSRMREESFGQELVVADIQYEDAGEYECQGINEEITKPIRRSFSLTVECRLSPSPSGGPSHSLWNVGYHQAHQEVLLTHCGM